MIRIDVAIIPEKFKCYFLNDTPTGASGLVECGNGTDNFLTSAVNKWNPVDELFDREREELLRAGICQQDFVVTIVWTNTLIDSVGFS